MVNPTKLIGALTLSSLSNNTKRKPWLSAFLKGSQLPIQLYPLPLLSCQGRGSSWRVYNVYPHTLLYFFASIFPETENLFTNSYVDDFIVSCSNSNVDRMIEALTAHSSNIVEWTDERGLATSAPKSTITLCTPRLAQSNTIFKSL